MYSIVLDFFYINNRECGEFWWFSATDPRVMAQTLTKTAADRTWPEVMVCS